MHSYSTFVRDNARWLTGGFLLTLFSSFGQTFFISLFGEEIRTDYKLSHGEFGSLYMLATLASAVTLPLIGRLVDVHSVSWTILLCVPMLAVATTSMALSNSLLLLLLTLYLLRLFGQGMMTHIAMTAMGRWYSGHRGRAVSLVSLGFRAGEALLPLIAVAVSAQLGWRQTWLLATAILLLVALPTLHALMKIERQPKHSDTPEKRAASKHWTRAEVLRDPIFWTTACAVLAPSFIGTSIFFHQDYLLDLKGWPANAFATSFVLFAAVSVTFSLLAGQLIDKFSSVSLLPFYLLPLALGCFSLAGINGQSGIFLFMALMGCSNGFSSVLFGALWPELYGTAHLGAVRSVITALMVLSSALGPGITGWLIDAGVPYTLQVAGMGVYCLLISVMMLRLKQQLNGRNANR